MNISNNISSIQSHQSMMNTSATNVANMSSKNSNTDLAKEMTNQIVASGGTEVNASAIKTQDEMLGSLLDIKA